MIFPCQSPLLCNTCMYASVQVLQRNVLAFTQENESSRLTLQTGLEDSRRRIQTSSKISGVVSGMDEVFDE